MYLFAAAEQASTAKLLAVFSKFKKRTRGLRVNEAKPDNENATNCNYYGFGVKKNQNVITGLCSKFLSRISTSTLTL